MKRRAGGGRVVKDFDALVIKYADWVIRYRLAVIALSLLLVIALGAGMAKIGFSSNYRVFFGQENPELSAFLTLQNTYTKNDNIVFIVQPSDKDLSRAEVAAALEDLTEKAWQIPYAIRVDSVTNFQDTRAEGDDLIVDDLIRDGADLSEEELDVRWARGKDEPLLFGSLIARDFETTGVNVTLQYPEKDVTEVPKAVAKARAIAQEVRAEHPDLTIVLSGISMMNNAFFESSMKDMQTLTPLMYLMLGVVMIAMLRSFLATLCTFMVIIFAVVSAMGWAGHAGISLTPISVVAPTIILTLAIADSIHIFVTMMGLMREGLGRLDALKESLRINFLAVFITSLTTIVGFLTLNTLDTPPFHDLGNITAMGVFLAWLYSVTFLPALLSLLPIKVKAVGAGGKFRVDQWMERYAEFIIRNRTAVLGFTAAVAVMAIALIPKLEINDQWVEYFDWSIPFRADAEFGLKELSGVYQVEYSIKAKDAGGISDPDYLRHLDAFTAWLRAQPDVEHVFSYTDIIKRLNKNMHGDDATWHRIPDERTLAAQYHLLYELSLPYGLDMNDRVDIDKSSTRLTATLRGSQTTKEVRAFIERSERWLKDNAPSHMHAVGTGPAVMFSHISERNIKSMLSGNAMAIGMISVIMILTLRSVGTGLLSIIPNALPILMAFGVWAVTYKSIGLASASVSAIALGIIVDDTVHFLTKYRRGRREKGLDRADAVRYAFRTVGRALIVTTIVLTLGFLVMALSSFQINKQLGLMTSLTMIIGLFMDFTLLPALLLIGYKNKGTMTSKGEKI